MKKCEFCGEWFAEENQGAIIRNRRSREIYTDRYFCSIGHARQQLNLDFEKYKRKLPGRRI